LTALNSEKESFDWFIKNNQIENRLTWKLKKEKEDKLGFIHKKYHQTYKEYTVIGSEIIFHYNTRGLYLVNGNLEDIKKTENKISLSSDEALHIAMRKYPSDQYQWECNEQIPPTMPELVVYPKGDGQYFYAYKIDLYSVSPLFRYHIFIDAEDGSDLGKHDQIMHTDVNGSGTTLYSGVKNFTTDSVSPGNYRLRSSLGGGTRTWDMNQTTTTQQDFTDADNYWSVISNQDKAARDVHYGVEKTYNYFYSKHNHSSYDDNNSLINSRVHYDVDFNNAFWDGTQLTFGDGDGINLNPLVTVDVVGHEFSHGVIQHTANLIYQNESGALNESFADIFGVCVDYFADSASANYLIGEQIFIGSGALRNMSNPNQYGDPDTYQGTNWFTGSADNGGVHTNSGVQNFWFYLLVNGGTGMNDNGNAYNISGIGMQKAAAIAYRNLSVYLTTSSNYAAARAGSIQSAIDLYGACSQEVMSVTNAWYAVGVGTLFSNAVTASFSANNTYSCSTPFTVSFTNSSLNAVSYLWSFGDGTTSTLINPTHTYTSAGVYDVQLIVNGSGTCGASADTLLIDDLIEVQNLGSLVSTTCNPNISFPSQYGVHYFKFDSLIDNQNTSNIYLDKTCDYNEFFTMGVPYNLRIRNNSYFTYKKIWIDYDNSGSFSDDEKVFSIYGNTPNQGVNVILNHSNPNYSNWLRMRVLSTNSSLDTSCLSVSYGQYRDYRIKLLPNTNPPIAGFNLNNTNVSTGTAVTFNNVSQNLPTSYQWSFPGGTPATSTAFQPSVTYNSPGQYNVQLIVSNSYGTDTLSIPNYVQASSVYTLCSDDSTNSPVGTLFDQGGPTGNYSNYTNCNFLINPGCANSVTLSFSSFDMESCCDYFRVYDGIDATGTLLLSANGTTIPSSVTANSGSMFIRFTSDYSGVGDGFEVNWTSVVPSTNPTANFVVSDTLPPYNTPVQFTDNSSALVNSWLWDFGDGTTSMLENPTKSYTSSGLKNVRLIVDNCFSTDTMFHNVYVQQTPEINIQPDTLNAVFSCTGTWSDSVLISNNGTGDLVLNTDGGDLEKVRFFVGGVSSTERTNVNAIMDTLLPAGVDYDTTYTLTTSSLQDVDLLIIGEATLSNFTLNSYSATLQNYVNNGGQVIHLGNRNYRMNALGLFNSLSYSTTSGASVQLLGNHPIVTNMGSNYLSLANLTYANNISNTGYESFANYGGRSVAGVRSIGTGNVYYLGYDYYTLNSSARKLMSITVHHILQNNNFNASFTSSLSSDTIAPSDSIYLSLALDSNSQNLLTGVYLDSILINSNDSLNASSYVYISYEITGAPQIEHVSSINFDTIQQGNSSYDTLVIENLGCDTLVIDSMVFSNIAFGSSLNSVTILPYSSDTAILTFSTANVGVFNDSVTIYNNDMNSVVYLNGVSTGAPIISFNPTSIVDTVFGCNDSIIVPVTVYNTGLGSLESTVDIFSNTGLGNGNGTGFFEGFENFNTQGWLNNSINHYQVSTSIAASGSKSLKLLASSAGINSNPLLKNFSSPMDVDYISFKMKGNSTSSGLTNYISFRNASGQEVIAVSKTSNKYRVFGNSTYNFSPANHTDWIHFEIKNINYTTRKMDVYIDGVLIYVNLGFWSGNYSTQGIQRIHIGRHSSSDHSYLDDVSLGSGVPVDWATASVDSIYVPANDSTTFNVVLNGSGLSNGTYDANVVFGTNIVQNPSDSLPISFTVIGEAEPTTNITCVNFPSTPQGTTLVDSFYLYNTGCADLTVNSLQTQLSVFGVTISNATIPANDSAKVMVQFSPLVMGTFTDTLSIINSIDTQKICLSGLATGAPDIDINPSTVTQTVSGCVDSVQVGFWVYNNGNDTLFYGNNTNNSFSEDFENLNYSTGFFEFGYGVYPNGSCGFHTGTKGLTYSGSGTRRVRSKLFIPNAGDSITFYYKAATIGSCNDPESGEYLRVEYQLNGTGTWNFLANANNFNGLFNYFAEEIPAALVGNSIKIRIRQTTHSGSSYDVWTIDDFAISSGANSFANYLVQGDSTYITQWILTSGLTNGQYTGSIPLYSNDPVTPYTPVMLSFNIENTPCASILDSLITSCSGAVGFSVDAVNTPTSYSWDFGDGGTSTLANPTHSYASTGAYVTTLIACNNFGCDTVSTSILVNSVYGPGPANCTPSTFYNYTNYDIASVNLGNISKTTAGTGSNAYHDYTCSDSTTLYLGDTYTLQVTTTSNYADYFKAWIDYNGNGVFDISEQIGSQTNGNGSYNVTFIVPNNLTEQEVRLRVYVDDNNISGPCDNIYYGEIEDYTIILKEKILLPVASFSAAEIDKCGGIFTFTDNSVNNPTSWLWNFGDGTTSILQNPTHQFSTSGIQNISLISTNSYGSDTVQQSIVSRIAEADIQLLSPLGLQSPMQFSNSTTGVSTYEWSFGDGNTSSLATPVHHFQNPQVYYVTLTVTNTHGCKATDIDTIDLTPFIGLDELEKEVSISPNPANDYIFIKNTSDQKVENVEIYSSIGQLMKKEMILSDEKEIKLDLTELPKGVYHLKINFKDQLPVTHKMVKGRE
jgi:Zn-dependent metalloprotease